MIEEAVEITGHAIISHHDGFGLNDAIRIEASDEDEHGVPHRFTFMRKLLPGEGEPKHEGLFNFLGFLHFQKGPRNVPGSTPGVTTDAPLAMLIHILKGFQAGTFNSREGALMLTKLEEAAMWSKARARDRADRGVLGYNKR